MIQTLQSVCTRWTIYCLNILWIRLFSSMGNNINHKCVHAFRKKYFWRQTWISSVQKKNMMLAKRQIGHSVSREISSESGIIIVKCSVERAKQRNKALCRKSKPNVSDNFCLLCVDIDTLISLLTSYWRRFIYCDCQDCFKMRM